jgi:C-terminal processing protease CtpA/Prc
MPAPPRDTVVRPAPVEEARAILAEQRRSNYGFQKVEILPGNIGYLELRGFVPIEHARDAAAAAMGFLANADALVIDLRRNGGGEPSMIQFLTSYLFTERTHLNSFEMRGMDALEEYWTFDEIRASACRTCRCTC